MRSPYENFLRKEDIERVLRDIIQRHLGVDYFSDDEDIRRASIFASGRLGGLGAGDGPVWEEAVRSDDLRRYASCSLLIFESFGVMGMFEVGKDVLTSQVESMLWQQ